MAPIDEFELIEKRTLVEPGPRARKAIDEHKRGRGMPKDTLQPIDGICCWCEKAPVRRRRGKYCSEDCNESAFYQCYPQKPQSKAFILIQLQGCACARCGVNYDDEIRQRVRERWAYQQKWKENPSIWADDYFKRNADSPITFWQIGNNTGHIWHVDHILPIHRGGASVGLANVQVLCVQCHKDKTAQERSAGWVEE